MNSIGRLRDLVRAQRRWIWLACVIGVLVSTPVVVTDDFWLGILVRAGIMVTAAAGLNLLVGYAGQVSLGHAAFVGTGAYAAGYLATSKGWPFPLWLIAAGVIGAVAGGVVGPIALRLRGSYLAIVSIGLVVVAQYVFENWESVTGGLSGTPVTAEIEVGTYHASKLVIFGYAYSRDQAYFWFVWLIAMLATVVIGNIARTRPGRAVQAIRDQDLAAEAVGIHLGRYKIGAFVVSSALAGLSGALWASYYQFSSPTQWSLALSIQFIAIVVVGGAGTPGGAVLGALVVGCLPEIVENFSAKIPFVATGTGESGILTVFELSELLFGALIVLFLMFEPGGLAAILRRGKRMISQLSN